MKKIIIPLLILVGIGVGIGFYMYNKPVQSLEKKKPDVEVSASQMIADYETDEKTANDKYLGKVVRVSGKVVDITTEAGKTKIHLESTNPMSMIICEMEEGGDAGLKTGDEARIKGLCSGYLSDVILVQCVPENL
jgi:starvation-inducible outer membrane lipoprotein